MTRKKLYIYLWIVLWFGASFCFYPPVGQTQRSNSVLSLDERIKLFDQVWRAIYDYYYDRNFHGVDWRQQREIFRPQIAAAGSSAEVYRILRRMIGRLGDAHTRIYSPEEGFDRFRPAGTTVGIVVRPIEDKPTIAFVEPGSEAYRLGIRPGFRLMRVDDQPVENLLSQIRKELGDSSTPTALELQSYDRLFSGARDTTLKVTLIDGEGRQRVETLTRRYSEFQRRVVVRQLPYRIGYIEITGFGPEIERDFDQAMQFVDGTQGLILDLRNNGGGFVTTVSHIASYFFPEQTDLGEFITRQGRATKRYTVRTRNYYRRPLILLVSSRSASGSEIFAAAMQERKRAIVLGTNSTTCGCLLGVSRTLKLIDGGKLNISDTNYRTARGRRIEGSGIVPDYQVDLRAADLLSGRDRTLERAVEQLSRTIAFGEKAEMMEFRLKVPRISVNEASRISPSSQFRR